MEPIEEDSSFVQKYGPVKVKYIKPPQKTGLFQRPYALNYFHDGVLYRTAGERGSSTMELFFDLLYVGIGANLAEAATEEATGAALGKYVLLFMGAYQIWTDMREFMDYYYNNDLSQKLYVCWIMILLVVYANNANEILHSKSITGLVVGCFILARCSAMLMTIVYSFFVMEHRKQMRYFCLFSCVSIFTMGFVIMAPLNGKIAIASCCFAYDIIIYTISFHPTFKRLIGATYSTALNIEHEVERNGAFVVIAIGEFLYTIVASSPAAIGLNERTARAILLLIIAYALCWTYFRGDGSGRAIHALRRSIPSAFFYVYLHIPLIMSLLLAADAGGTLTRTEELYPIIESLGEAIGDSELSGVTAQQTILKQAKKTLASKSIRLFGRDTVQASEIERADYLHSVQLMFGGGIAVALVAMTALALCDKSLDTTACRKWHVPSWLPVAPRILVAGAILGMGFARMKITLYIGITAALVVAQLLFENIMESPSYHFYCDEATIETEIEEQEEVNDQVSGLE